MSARRALIRGPAAWPASDRLADWGLGAAMNRGAAVVARHAVVGEEAARDRLCDRVVDVTGFTPGLAA